MSSYGTPSDVAALARVWTNNGAWVNPVPDYAIRGTNPTMTTVQDWLDNVSAQMNVALGSQFFKTPIDPDESPNTYKAVTQYVVSLVSEMCHQANNIDRDVPPEGKIMKDMAAWVQDNADGFGLDSVKISEGQAPKNQVQFRMIG